MKDEAVKWVITIVLAAASSFTTSFVTVRDVSNTNSLKLQYVEKTQIENAKKFAVLDNISIKVTSLEAKGQALEDKMDTAIEALTYTTQKLADSTERLTDVVIRLDERVGQIEKDENKRSK